MRNPGDFILVFLTQHPAVTRARASIVIPRMDTWKIPDQFPTLFLFNILIWTIQITLSIYFYQITTIILAKI